MLFLLTDLKNKVTENRFQPRLVLLSGDHGYTICKGSIRLNSVSSYVTHLKPQAITTLRAKLELQVYKTSFWRLSSSQIALLRASPSPVPSESQASHRVELL